VTFVPDGGGQVTGAVAQTNASGVATIGSWTLLTVGARTLTATVTDLEPVTITATARLPYWTVAVYMAADNNLALSGIQDIDEMEAATPDPEVQVVLQAEFSPITLVQSGCASPSCFGRPDYATFRYQVAGGGTSRPGPDGPSTGIGNRNMATPAELADFVRYARTTAPSEHLAIVLWNHGGGYTGLLADETSSPGVLMSVDGMRQGLQSAGGVPLDLLVFDMCLMGGYETLVSVNGLTRTVVFSEETEPGNGHDYTRLLTALAGAASQASPRAAASAIADAYNASYAGARPSTTVSAYDLSGFSTFERALDDVAATLAFNLAGHGAELSQAALGSQRYSLSELTDLVDLADSLAAATSDAALDKQIGALRTAALASEFRLRSHARNGPTPGFGGVSDVERSTGLTVMLPRTAAAQELAASGPRSLDAYLSSYGTTGWGQLVAAYTAAATSYAVTDLGANRLETYLVWSGAAQSSGVDIDLWVLEPNGVIASPYFGTVSPNGTLTADSYTSGLPIEGYLTNRVVMNGVYVWYAFLVNDPAGVRPQVDLAYRYGQDVFASIFGAGPYPTLSRDASVFSDPDPTFAEANAMAYTDLVPVATATFGPPTLAGANRTRPGAFAVVASRSGRELMLSGRRGPTRAQLGTIQRLLATRRASHLGDGLSMARPGLRVPSVVRGWN
jgi:hypothetical protein